MANIIYYTARTYTDIPDDAQPGSLPPSTSEKQQTDDAVKPANPGHTDPPAHTHSSVYVDDSADAVTDEWV